MNNLFSCDRNTVTFKYSLIWANYLGKEAFFFSNFENRQQWEFQVQMNH